jgi:hypothetical protein
VFDDLSEREVLEEIAGIGFAAHTSETTVQARMPEGEG